MTISIETMMARKRRYGQIIVGEISGGKVISNDQCIISKESTNFHIFPLLELPVHIICNIISRLPLKSIIQCRCVCKMLTELVKDPYFSKMNLDVAPSFTANLIVEENIAKSGSLHFFTCDVIESTFSSCSSNDQNILLSFDRGLPALNKRTAEFSFLTERLTLIGSSDGLLCLYFNNSSSEPFYGICNPILGEFLRLPRLSAPSFAYANHSGFGYCPRLKQYKVVSFMYPDPKDKTKMVASVHTLGSDSWRNLVRDAPTPKQKSFDPLLNGSLHWITTSSRPSELICSFDLEKETFVFVPPPPHFNTPYMRKVSWINIGVLKGCVCICFIYEDIQFEVWSMREYGIQSSWSKEFIIHMKFYCQLRVEDLRRPIKLLSNGDLWFISSFDTLVSFSPQKRTFRELRTTGRWSNSISAHDLSFVSIRDIAGGRSTKLFKYRVGSSRVQLDVLLGS